MAVTRYVKNGGDNGSTGVDDAHAWATLTYAMSQITGTQSDSFLYLKCGSTWAEQMTIGASGTASHPYTITSYDTGAKPVIDGGLTRNYCIYSSSKNYYTIDGLQLKDAIHTATGGGATGGNIAIQSGTGVVIQNCDIIHPNARGIYTGACASLTITNNLIDTGADVNNQYEADGIYMQNGAGGHVITHNTVLERRAVTAFYIDGIQTYNEDGGEIAYNFLSNPTGYGSAEENMLIQLEAGSGTWDVHNNILFNDTNQHSIVPLDSDSATFHIYNNTIINLAGGGSSFCLATKASVVNSSFLIKNNIFYTGSSVCLYLRTGVAAPGQIDYNCYYRVSGTAINNVSESDKTWAQWKALGYDAHGYNTDPLLVNVGT